MKNHFPLILVFIAIVTAQCKKSTQEDHLPPITTTGANTFGCLVNGNVWLPYGSWSLPALTSSINNDSNGTSELYIDTHYRKNGASSDIGITILHLTLDTGSYRIDNYLNRGLVYVNQDIYYEPFDTFGIVHIIRYDTIQKIISGTFSFEAYTGSDHSTSKSVSITDGRFDLHYPLTIH